MRGSIEGRKTGVCYISGLKTYRTPHNFFKTQSIQIIISHQYDKVHHQVATLAQVGKFEENQFSNKELLTKTWNQRHHFSIQKDGFQKDTQELSWPNEETWSS
jgi:hypothetical protein